MTESVPVTEFIVRCECQEFLGERHYHRCEPIVRCRDCVYMCAEYSTVDKHGEVISTGYLCEWTELWTKPDGFCSWAERRDA